MSISIPSRESLKEKAKVIRQFMKEKHNVDVPHGHCMEMISQLFGFNDWNTASAALKPNEKSPNLPIQIKTVGDMKQALELFKDTDTIDADYEFNLKEFLDDMEDDATSITQEFSLSFESFNEDIVTFKLKLEEESATFE